MVFSIFKLMLRITKKIEDVVYGGPLFLNRLGKHFREMTYEGNFTFLGFVALGWYAFILWGCLGALKQDNTVIYGIGILAIALLLFISTYDLHVIEAFWVGYKKSDYYLSTGTKRSQIWFDKGLQGEFMAYVLSRELKMDHRVLYNVCVPMENGNFQEVDAIIITNNLIYVLECKNRGGYFQGRYDEEKWIQTIGHTQNECGNIYMQNQKHTMAIDQLLLKAGIIPNGQSACVNYVLCAGVMSLPGGDVPIDFAYGTRTHLVKYIKESEKMISAQNGGGNAGIMQQVYELLLPYSLYTNEERKAMMQTRDRIAKSSKDFALGGFQVRRIPRGISRISEPGEEAIIRRNRIYKQILLVDGNRSCWQTRTDIPVEYFR